MEFWHELTPERPHCFEILSQNSTPYKGMQDTYCPTPFCLLPALWLTKSVNTHTHTHNTNLWLSYNTQLGQKVAC